MVHLRILATLLTVLTGDKQPLVFASFVLHDFSAGCFVSRRNVDVDG